jgi:predicted RecA/RadA family phage recombinase
MANNFVQDGATVDAAANATVTAGTGMLIGNLFGIALNDAASGAPVRLRTEGVFTIAKTSALVISIGDRLFWDATNKVVNKTSAAQVCVGVALSAAANPSATVQIKLAPVAVTPAGT